MMNRNKESAQTAVRTRKLMLKPNPQGEGEFSVNVLPVGTHLGEFEIKGLIGEGGFGIVYLAYDHSLERQVALKEYMPSGLATRTTKMAVSVRSQKKMDTFTAGLKSFINEARMLAQFDSPALVKVHSFWEGNGTAYMVMPYYEGMTLKQALQTHKIQPTEGWIRMLLADLCDAIDILHRAHCLHRDIAPDNILLLKDGRPLLLDFGAARRVIGDLTQCFTAILKPGFAPIEQYADIAGLRQGAWTDIYALAAVVYYLITGKAPPPSVARMVHDELVPAREAGKGRYSEAFLATIDKALAVRPEQRFHSIDELRRAFNIMEPEPRTVPYPGGEWSTTVARTVPLTPPAGEKLPAGPAAPVEPAARAGDADDFTRHVAPSASAAEDITAIAPPMRQTDPTPAQGSRAAPPAQTAYAGAPQNRQGNGQGARQDIPGERVAPASASSRPFPAPAGPSSASSSASPVPPSSAPSSRSSSSPRVEPGERIEPELLSATQMAGDWHQSQGQHMPPHRHEEDAAVPRRRDKQGWLVLALLFAAGIGSGIYLGTNHSWDGLSEHAVDSESTASAPPLAGAQPEPSAQSPAQSSGPPSAQASEQSLPAAVPPSADASAGTASSGSSDSSAAAGAPGTLGAPDETVASTSRLRSEIDLWKRASKSNQISGYENYLREYPQGRYATIARLRLERLQAAAAPKPPLPEQATTAPKPALPETGKADAGKSAPVAPTPWIKPEEAAWTRATEINSAASYKEYLRKYPRGGYAALARDRLASMKSAATASASLSSSHEARLPATLPAASASRDAAGAPQVEAQQHAAASVKPHEGSAPTVTPSVASSGAAATSGASSTAAASPPATSAPVASAPPASTPATVPTAPPQASALPAKPKEANAQEHPAAVEPPSQVASSVAGKTAAPSTPPLASIKPRDVESPADSAIDTSARTIKVADQTMTGDFTVDKKSGLVSGKGKISWSNGNQFEGTLVQGSKEGKGKFIWNSGQRYSGDWTHDVPNGKGIFIFPDGSRYEGEVKDGMPHGQGTTHFKNGIAYTGDWVRGKLHGHGRYIWADGSYWEGEFRDDKKTENGRMYFPNKSARNAADTTPAPATNVSPRAAAADASRQSEEK
jgi:serine/threonine protein kinase